MDYPFPTVDLTYSIPKPQWFVKALPDFSSDNYIQFTAYGIAPAYADIMATIRILASRYQTAADCSSASEYSSVLTILCSTMQRLLSLPDPFSEMATAAITNASEVSDPWRLECFYITKACRHALVVHVFAQWIGHQPDPALVVSNILHELQSACRSLLSLGCRTPLLVWVMAVGGVGALGTPERKWFVGHMVGLVTDLGITSWEEFRRLLMKVIWHEHQDESTHRLFWEEMNVKLDDD